MPPLVNSIKWESIYRIHFGHQLVGARCGERERKKRASHLWQRDPSEIYSSALDARGALQPLWYALPWNFFQRTLTQYKFLVQNIKKKKFSLIKFFEVFFFLLKLMLVVVVHSMKQEILWRAKAWEWILYWACDAAAAEKLCPRPLCERGTCNQTCHSFTLAPEINNRSNVLHFLFRTSVFFFLFRVHM